MEAPESDQSALKRHKPTPNPEKVEDRISELPDSILSLILSKLPTKPAAATAFLSTRWKHLFSQIPNLQLNIHDNLLLRHVSSSPTTETIQLHFAQFLNHLLTVALKDVPRVHKWFMDLEHVYDDDHVEAWVSAIVRLNVSELWIFFAPKFLGMTPDVVFCSESLSTLILGCHNFRELSSSILLPNLKNLCLVNVTFAKGDSLERIISSCPVLDTLSVSHCKFEEFVNVLRISSPSVKNLRVFALSGCCGDETYDTVLDMPALESIHYVDRLPESYIVENFSCAREAYIDIGPTKKQFQDEDAEVIWQNMHSVRDLVGACSNVCTLFLSNISVVALTCSPRPLPTFHYLRNLELGCISITGWELLPQFFESTPNLEVLVFRGGFSQFEGCYEVFRNNVPEHVPRCLNLHLHTIKFEAFKGKEDELDLVEFFLKHALLLRKIYFKFSYSLSSDEICFTKSKLWSSRSNSKKLEVDFAFEVEFDYRKLYCSDVEDSI